MNFVRALTVLSLAFVIACATMTTEANLQNARAHYKIGVAYLNDNKAQLAFVEFQKSYELNPHDKEVLNAIGIIYLQYFDETAKAVDFFEKAVGIDAGYSEAYNNLGFAHEKLGHFDTAISFYKKALANLLYANPEKAYISMGNSYYRLGKYEAAILSYKEAIKRAPNLSLPYLKLALCYNALGKYGEASTAMTYYLKLNPSYKGDREKALEDFTIMKLKATGPEEKDIGDYIEIIKY